MPNMAVFALSVGPMQMTSKIFSVQQVFLCKPCLKPFKTELSPASFNTLMRRLYEDVDMG